MGERTDWKCEKCGKEVATWSDLMGGRCLDCCNKFFDARKGKLYTEEELQQEIEKAREEGFDDGVKRTVDVVQEGLDELLLERGEDKYWVGDILRNCNSSVEKLLPEGMKHYKSKLN